MKKFSALFLAIVLTLSSFSCVAFAAVENEGKLPVIYIEGKGNSPIYKLDENGNYLLNENNQYVQIKDPKYPFGMSRLDYIKTQISPVMQTLMPALITGDYSDYIQSLVDAAAPLYDEQVLNSDGESPYTDICWDYSVQNPYKNVNGMNFYIFKYDWRMSPYDIADELHQYIEYVCRKEGVSKVNIQARCLGTNVTAAYLAKFEEGCYGDTFRVNNLVLNTTPLAGYIVVGALMSGSVVFDQDSVDRFVTFYLNNNDLFDDPFVDTVAAVLVSVSNQLEMLGLAANIVTNVYESIQEELIPQLALCSYGSLLSYWSMISDKYYDKAKLAVFGTTEAEGEYAKFIEKIDIYHNLVGDVDENTGIAKYETLLTSCEEKYGMKTAVFAKYGSLGAPLFEGSDITGDVRGTVTELSLGAVGTVIGECFTDEQIEEFKKDENFDEKYISPDKKVYAGTCLFPETTWFSKNLAHDSLVEIDPIANAFLLSDGNFTVDSDERYPQFHEYVNGEFKCVEEADPTDSVWTNDPFAVLIKFFKMIIEVIKRFFAGA